MTGDIKNAKLGSTLKTSQGPFMFSGFENSTYVNPFVEYSNVWLRLFSGTNFDSNTHRAEVLEDHRVKTRTEPNLQDAASEFK